MQIIKLGSNQNHKSSSEEETDPFLFFPFVFLWGGFELQRLPAFDFCVWSRCRIKARQTTRQIFVFVSSLEAEGPAQLKPAALQPEPLMRNRE